MDRLGDVTALLCEMRTGDKSAEARLLELVYPQLRKMARRERTGHTLQATALVNEVYLQMVGRHEMEWQNRSHFYAVAATLMRRILVDYARQKKATKRAGGRRQIELTDALAIADNRLDEILSIDEALHRLAEFDPRRCRVVELRFFGGMTEAEVADVLGVAPRTVKRDWNVAKAWLHGELSKGNSV
jgi:RNA polymerase sigma factor (TIGR02999 family)